MFSLKDAQLPGQAGNYSGTFSTLHRIVADEGRRARVPGIHPEGALQDQDSDSDDLE
jgi:hypothetical protein